MVTGFRVLNTGPFALLQDAGRYGWQHLGVSPSGPMDVHAAAWANYVLGNAWGAPLLEVALGPLCLEAQVDTWVAVCGAELPITVDEQVQSNWSGFAIRRGQILTLGRVSQGQRAYVAVKGGFRIPSILGSVACQQRESLGGVHGHGGTLRMGDWLPCQSAQAMRGASVPTQYRPNYRQPAPMRVITGGDYAYFAESERQKFWASTWQVSTRSDRMGIRWQGVPLQGPKRSWSLGVVTGTLQVPPDGQPIVLMSDRQTMGGYPVLGWLHPFDGWRLAQCAPHQSFSVQPVELTQAQRALRQFYQFFRGA